MWANVLDVALSVCGWMGIVLLLHGLLLWEYISIRRMIAGGRRKRKRKKKSRSRDANTVRIMLLGAAMSAGTGMLRILQHVRWDEAGSIGLVCLWFPFAVGGVVGGLQLLYSGRTLSHQFPTLTMGIRTADRGTWYLLFGVALLAVIQHPIVAAEYIVYPIYLVSISLWLVLYHRRNQRWRNQELP